MAGSRRFWDADPRDLEVVRTMVDETRHGRGLVLSLEGSLGTGKTSFLDQTEQLALEQGVPVLRAHADRSERALPFGVIRQLVHGLSLAARGRPVGRARMSSVESAAWRLIDVARDSRHGLLVLVDDADEIDDPSLDVLGAVARRCARTPVSIVLAVRGASRRPGLHRLRTAGKVLSLGELGTDDVSRILGTHLGDITPEERHEIVSRTGGLPFLLAGVLMAAERCGTHDLGVPAEVRNSIRVLLTDLGADAARLVEAATVLGNGANLYDTARLAELATEHAAQLADELADRGVFARGDSLRFAQPMMGDAVREDIAPHARSGLHRKAATQLASRRADPDLIDAHLMVTRPGGDAWVAERLVLAARRAEERGESEAVVDCLTRALAEPPPPEATVEVLLALAAAKLARGDASAAQDLQRVLRLDAPAPAVAHAKRLLSQLWFMQGDTLSGVAMIEEALQGTDLIAAAQAPLVSRYLTMTVLNSEFRQRLAPVATTLTAAARAGALPEDPGVAAHVALQLAWQGGPAGLVRRVVERAFAADPLIDPETQGALLGFAVRALVAMGQLTEAEQACTRAAESASARDLMFGVSCARYHRGLVRLDLGTLESALEDVTAAGLPASLGWRAADPWRGELLVRIHLARGDITAAQAALSLAAGTAETRLGYAYVMDARAHLALAMDRPEDAFAHAMRARRCLEAFGQDTPTVVPWRDAAARAAYALQRHGEAEALAHDAVCVARTTMSPVILGASLVAAGVVSPAARAVPLLEEACELLQNTPARLAHGRALVALGRALRQNGRRAEARNPLRSGLGIAATTRSRPLAHVARSELVASGARPRREAVVGPAALTPSERRVADLAAAGRTNLSIASELSVSLKTVETHLGQTYRKLGITGRPHLADALRGSRV
jgi:DNA-binding CsgD family transcriptional regulator